MSINIYIDQGHNPASHNQGAEGHHLLEGDINYHVGSYLAAMLNQDGRFTARLSRENPDEVLGYSNASSLSERVHEAEAWPADYFLSIHTNANNNPDVSGAEMYIYSQGGEAYPLAQHLLRGITEATGVKDNGVRTNPRLFVLRASSMPAVLAELGYISNTIDAEILRDRQYDYATGLYNGIKSYFFGEEIPKPSAELAGFPDYEYEDSAAHEFYETYDTPAHERTEHETQLHEKSEHETQPHIVYEESFYTVYAEPAKAQNTRCRTSCPPNQRRNAGTGQPRQQQYAAAQRSQGRRGRGCVC